LLFVLEEEKGNRRAENLDALALLHPPEQIKNVSFLLYHESDIPDTFGRVLVAQNARYPSTAWTLSIRI
jgi:hypothetical protein